MANGDPIKKANKATKKANKATKKSNKYQTKTSKKPYSAKKVKKIQAKRKDLLSKSTTGQAGAAKARAAAEKWAKANDMKLVRK